MSARAGEIGSRRPELERLGRSAARLHGRIEGLHPSAVLGGAIVLQWAVVLVFALTVRHNGWIFYQGGDQLWYYSLAHELAHGQISPTNVGYLWSFVLSPFAALAGPNLVSALPAIVLFDVLVLLPVALLALYGIGARIGGRVFGYWTLLVWIVLPFVGILYTNPGYHQKYTELLLPQAFGLTALADFPALVAVLVMLYFAVRVVLDAAPSLADAAAVGMAAGVAVAIKPSNSLLLLGPVLAFVAVRRLPALAAFAVALVPSLITLALWKQRGLGQLPLLGALDGRAPAGVAAIAPLAGLNLHHYLRNLSWSRLAWNIDLLREHFWSGHFAIWLLFAGLVAVSRRSLGVAALVLGTALPFVLIKFAYTDTSFEDGSLFRILIPVYPLFVLGVASLPLLLPGAPRHLPAWRPTWTGPAPRVRAGLVIGAVLIAAALPLGAIAASRTQVTSVLVAYYNDTLLPIPTNVDLGLRAHVDHGNVLLTWRKQRPLGGRVFYWVWRDKLTPGDGVICRDAPGAEACTLRVTPLAATGGPARYDRPPRGTWVYRVGVAANWLNDPQYGDVYLAGEPVVVRVP